MSTYADTAYTAPRASAERRGEGAGRLSRYTLAATSARLIRYRRGALAALLALAALVTPFGANAAFSLPPKLTEISEGAFQGCGGLGDVVIPDGVTKIGANAFADCVGLTSLWVPKSALILDANALGRAGAEHTIYGHPNSTAARYARDYGIAFESHMTEREALLAYAHDLLGEPYSKYDCVIFVYTCYKNALGIKIEDTCREIQNNTKGVRIDNINDLMPGDIICWRDDSKEYCTHVGMYVGAGTTYLGDSYSKGVFIESSSGYKKVRYNYLPSSGNSYYVRNFLCAWRILK